MQAKIFVTIFFIDCKSHLGLTNEALRLPCKASYDNTRQLIHNSAPKSAPSAGNERLQQPDEESYDRRSL